MAKKDIYQVLQDIVEPVVKSFGLEIWGIDVLQSGRPIVRIFVDVAKSTQDNLSNMDNEAQDSDMQTEIAAHSASVEQCAKISRMVGLALEVEDIFSSAYVLEVSSPGLSRPFFKLQQLAAFVDHSIEIVLTDFLPKNEDLPAFAHGRKKFSGKLLGITESTLKLNVEHGDEHYPLEFAWENVRKATRLHIFTMPEKPGKKRKDVK